MFGLDHGSFALLCCILVQDTACTLTLPFYIQEYTIWSYGKLLGQHNKMTGSAGESC